MRTLKVCCDVMSKSDRREQDIITLGARGPIEPLQDLTDENASRLDRDLDLTNKKGTQRSDVFKPDAFTTQLGSDQRECRNLHCDITTGFDQRGCHVITQRVRSDR